MDRTVSAPKRPLVTPGEYKPWERHYSHILGGLLLRNKSTAPKSLLLTSARDSEGKTTTAANLATVLAGSGEKTLLMDANFSRPALAGLYGGEGRRGLCDVLKGACPTEEAVITHKDLPDLDIMPGGEMSSESNTLVLLGGFVEVLGTLESQYDRVVVDGSSANEGVEPLVIGQAVDGVVLVILSDGTQRDEAVRAKERIEKYGGTLLGAVLNKVPGYVTSRL